MANPISGSSVSNDVISDSMTRIATTASKQKKLVAVAAVLLLATTLAASLYLSKRNAFRSQASEALFKARQTLSTETKTYAESLKPAEKKVELKEIKKDTKAAAPKKLEAPLPNIEFAKFDVDSLLKAGVAALEKVAEGFPGTQPGFDAKMQLGSLYFDHAANASAFGKASLWFEAATLSAPTNELSISALYNLAYAQEALGRCADSVKTFDRALNSGSGPLLGELLRGKARCQETLGDKAAAKATYENMIKLLPNTEASKFAEMKKASL